MSDAPDTSELRDLVEALLGDNGGVLRLEPAFVARGFLPPGRRLGLPESAYDVGGRGFICERWLASTTKADNRVGPDDEGLSAVHRRGEAAAARCRRRGARPSHGCDVRRRASGRPRSSGQAVRLRVSGKRLVVEPGGSVELIEPGVYSVFVWAGSGTFAGHEVRDGRARLDELLVSHETATRPHTVVNTGPDDLMLFSLFGPDLHLDVPAAGVAR